MKKQNEKDPQVPINPKPVQPDPLNDAIRSIRKENEDLNPDLGAENEGPGHAPEGAGADTPITHTHGGQTTRGSYATDSSTGSGRYMDRTSGSFGMEPVDKEEEEPIDPKID